MPSCTDTAGHTKAFDYPVLGGKASSTSGTRTDRHRLSNRGYGNEEQDVQVFHRGHGIEDKTSAP